MAHLVSSLLRVLTTEGVQELASPYRNAGTFFAPKGGHLGNALEVEAVAEDQFGDQVIGRTGHANAKAEVDFPLGGKIQVNRRKDLVLLLADGGKIGGRPD